VCFPKGSRFNVTSVIAASSTPKSTTAGSSGTAPPAGSTLAPSNTQQVSGYFESGFDPFHPWASIPANARPCDSDLPGAAAPVIAVTDRTYTFDGQTLAKSDFYREGFTWGGLVIPYKFYFKDKSIKSNSSVVGFAGYEGWFPGVSLSTIVALGGGTAPTPASSSSSTTSKSSTSSMTTNTTTLVTYTAAVGFIAAFGDGTVKAGLMFGRDYQGNAAAFPYENKTWMALSIGAGF